MLMIEPRPRAHIAGPNSWHGSRTPPTRLRSKFARQSSSAMDSTPRSAVTVTFGSLPPAAFTSTVGAPSAAAMASCAAWTEARSMASTLKNCAVPPASRMVCTRASPRSALRPRTATFAPACARPSASAPPRTPVAPMTTATSPVRSKRLMAWRRQRRPGPR